MLTSKLFKQGRLNLSCIAFNQTNLSKADYEKAFTSRLQTFKQRHQIVYGQDKADKIKEVAARIEPHRIEHIKGLVKSYFLLGMIEKNYANLKMKDLLLNKDLSEVDLNTNWVSLTKSEAPVEPVNPSYFKQNEFMSEFTKWLKTQEKVDIGFSSQTSTQVASGAEQKAEKVEVKEVKKEEKKEKEIWDLVLLSYDPAKKITVIKEIRAITSLGLKESKDLVETLPSKILTKVKKDEAKPHIDKIEAAGGKVELQ